LGGYRPLVERRIRVAKRACKPQPVGAQSARRGRSPRASRVDVSRLLRIAIGEFSGLMSRLLPSLRAAGKVVSAGFAEFDQQGLHLALANQISHFMKGEICAQVRLENRVFDA
jgi:hypothetical protein